MLWYNIKTINKVISEEREIMSNKCSIAFVIVKYLIIICLTTMSVIGFIIKEDESKKSNVENNIESISIIKPTADNNLKETEELTEEIIVLEIVDTIKEDAVETKDVIAESVKIEEAEEIKEEEAIPYIELDAPKTDTIKSYMSYRAITSKSSRQYKLQNSLAYTDNNGLRMVNGRYCVALGSYYTTTIGQWVDIELENGEIIQGILADCKSNKHTDATNRICFDGSVVEFVVDTKTLDKTAKKMGDISYLNNWNSKVASIKVYDKVEAFE